MQNDFEKQVQQKMEELKLTPSAPVWVNVEKQIRKKREKRRFIFFILPVGLLIGAGIWWMLSENNLQKDRSGSSNHTISTAKKQNIPVTENELKTIESKIDEKQAATTPPQHAVTRLGNQVTITETKNKLIQQSKIVSSKKTSSVSSTRIQSKPYSSKTKTIILKAPETTTGQVDVVATDNKIGETKKNNVVFHNVQVYTNDSMVKNDTIIVTGNLPAINIAKNENKIVDSVVIKDSAKKEPSKPEIKIADSAAKKKVAKVNNKWERTYTLQAGISSYNEGVFSGQKSLLASPILNSGGGAMGSGGGQRFPMYDSAGKNNGFSFAVGSGLKRKLGEKFEFSASLQYHFFSVKGWVGNRRTQDTAVLYQGNRVAVSDFYTNGNSNNYTTKYGVLELPVRIGYQPFKRIPLQLSAGTSYGRLLHSNELTFDNSRNIYYRNKENRVKNFFNLFTSLQYRVFAKTKMKVTTGPLVQYSLSKTQRENQYTRPYLFFAGIKTDINF